MFKRTLPLACSLLVTGCVVGDDDGQDDDLLIEGKTTATLRIIQHNIEKRPNVLREVLAYAKNIDATGIALEEVCPADSAWLVSTYGNQWSIAVTPGNKPTLSGCDLPGGTHDIPGSVAIWTGGKGGKATAYPHLAGPAGSPGQMACIQFDRAGVPVHLCAAHLNSTSWTDPATGTKYDGEELRAKETAFIKQLARDEWFAGNKNHFGIVAGDFNGKPDTAPLDKMYDPALGGTGDFVDYNRGNGRNGQVTAVADGSNTEDGQPINKQIDYIFFSTNRAPLDGPAVDLKNDDSDHHRVTATVHMRK